MFLCPHSCSFVSCDIIPGVVHSQKFAQVRRDQNRSLITCVRCKIADVRSFFAPSSVKVHRYMKQWKGSILRNTRLQGNEYQGIKMNDYWVFGDVHILTTTSWRNGRSALRTLSRSEKLFVGKFYRMDSLSCGSKGKSSSASILLSILNKIRSNSVTC